MLLRESLWLKNTFRTDPIPESSTILNFGSHNVRVLKRSQPWVLTNVIDPVIRSGHRIVNFDLYQGEGVDLYGDILENDMYSELKALNIDTIFFFNVLEHLKSPQEICQRIESLITPGKKIIVTVPFSYPFHNDPIDNALRPSPGELLTFFSTCRIVRGEIVNDYTYLRYLKRSPLNALIFATKLIAPFYRFNNWKTQVAMIPYLFKRFQVTCAVLEKL